MSKLKIMPDMEKIAKKGQDIFPVLLVIDLQKQFKDNRGQYEKCIRFIEEHINEYYVIGTVFSNHNGSMYEKHLGWSGCSDVSSTDIEYHHHRLVDKQAHYGMNTRNELGHSLADAYKAAMKQQNTYFPHIKYSVIGCDADACVFAAAFYLWDKEEDFEILTDYIYSTGEDVDLDSVIKLMKRNFGDCVK